MNVYDETKENVGQFYGIASRNIKDMMAPSGDDQEDDDSGLAY